jgi:hypothetical protein
MIERIQPRTKQWIAHIGFFLFLGVASYLVADYRAHPRTTGGIVGVWGNERVPAIAFYPDHTFSYLSANGLAGEWFELKETDAILLVYRNGFSQGFTVTAKLQRKPLRLNYTEWDMVCSFEKVGTFVSTK